MDSPIPNKGDSLTQISMDAAHVPLVARWQHLGAHFADERARLEAELRYVMGQAQRAENELVSFLQRTYGIDAQHTRVEIDTHNAIILAVTPVESERKPSDASASE